MQKTVLITGGNSGIGKATAQQLAQQNWKVIIASRSTDKAEQAIADIKQRVPQANISYLQLDLSSMESVRHLVANFKTQHSQLDVLINNAGGIWDNKQITPEGIEYSFAANHLGHFLLTNLLLEQLQKPKEARIINVSSEMHRSAKFDIEKYTKSNYYNSWLNYGFNKLCNVLFTYQLAKHLKGTNISVNALHPGVIGSNFGSGTGILSFLAPLTKRIFTSVEKGARPSVHLATCSDPPNSSYFNVLKLAQSSAESYREEHQIALWQYSQQLTNV